VLFGDDVPLLILDALLHWMVRCTPGASVCRSDAGCPICLVYFCFSPHTVVLFRGSGFDKLRADGNFERFVDFLDFVQAPLYTWRALASENRLLVIFGFRFLDRRVYATRS